MSEHDYVLQLIDEQILQFTIEREEAWKKSEEQRVITEQKALILMRLETMRTKYLENKDKEGTGH